MNDQVTIFIWKRKNFFAFYIQPGHILHVNKGWNDTEASCRLGSGQGWEQAETYSSFVLLPIQVFAYEYTCSTTRLCILQFTHDRFWAFGQTWRQSKDSDYKFGSALTTWPPVSVKVLHGNLMSFSRKVCQGSFKASLSWNFGW